MPQLTLLTHSASYPHRDRTRVVYLVWAVTVWRPSECSDGMSANSTADPTVC